jgi:hypothetical protein
MAKVTEWIRLYGRWQRYNVLPEEGGLFDQDERTLHAFDVIGAAFRMPRVDDEEK